MDEEHQREVSGVGRRRFTAGRIVLCVAVLLVALAAFVLWLRAPPDPVYKGKRLSTYWYETLPPPVQFQSGIPPSQQAYFKQLISILS